MKLGRKRILEEEIPGLESVKVNREKSGEEAKKFYKKIAPEIEKDQETNTIPNDNGDEYTKKVNQAQYDDGTGDPIVNQPGMVGMTSYKYDVTPESEVKKSFDDRIDKLNTEKGYNNGGADGGEEDETYTKIKKASKEYKDYKYNKPNKYSNSYPVRVDGVDGLKDGVGYMDIKKENILRANGKLVSEEQVLKLAKKVPSRLMFENSVFAITDLKGEKYYRILIEDEEPRITHTKEPKLFKESFNKMKSLWSYGIEGKPKPKDNLSESDFKKLLNKGRDII